MGFIAPLAIAAAAPTALDFAGSALAGAGMANAAFDAFSASDALGAMLPSARTTALLAGGTKALGELGQGQAESQSSSYNAEIAELNAATATKNAQFAGQIGEQNTYQEQQKTREQVSGIKANQAASGIDVNTGSAPVVRQSAEEIGGTAAFNARQAAQRAAYGDYQQAAADTTKAEMDTSEAKQYSRAGEMSAASTLLNTASNPFLGYLQGKSLTGE